MLRAVLDIVLPPLCLSCQDMVAGTHGFCPSCWGKLDFISDPLCSGCGLPFAFDVPGGEMLCGACLQERPVFCEARAALSYTDNSRALIVPFKHSDRTDAAPALARLMLAAGAKLIEASDVIVPVPLHGVRLFMRRYNQAALLAGEIAKLKKKPIMRDALVRVKPTPSQGRLTRMQRFDNMRGAFRVHSRHMAMVKDKAVLLIDDVMTTGATANACAAALLKAGARDVRVLCAARVSKEH